MAELGHPVARVIAGPDGADLGRAEHDREPFDRRRRQRGDPVATGDAGRQQGPGPTSRQFVESAIPEPRPTVDGGLAVGLARGMEADALADPPGVYGQSRHAHSFPGVSRSNPPNIVSSSQARPVEHGPYGTGRGGSEEARVRPAAPPERHAGNPRESLPRSGNLPPLSRRELQRGGTPDQQGTWCLPGSAGILPAVGRRPTVVHAGKMPALPGRRCRMFMRARCPRSREGPRMFMRARCPRSQEGAVGCSVQAGIHRFRGDMCHENSLTFHGCAKTEIHRLGSGRGSMNGRPV